MLSSASNKKISDSSPAEYLPSIVSAAGEKLDEWLVSNLIPREAFDVALRNDFNSFLRIRAEYIHVAVTSKAGWSDGSATGSITTSQVPENDDSVE